MYPEIVIPSYSLLLILGVVAAVLNYRFVSTKINLLNKAYDHYSFAAIVSIAVGLVSAMLFQSFYNFIETGVFKLEGLTFMGGLLGGAACFIIFALTAKDPTVKRAFFPVAEIAAPCIAIAHCLGRIGCFMSGCCYGVESEHGLFFPSLGKTVLPTQLYEAIFLLALFGVLEFFVLSKKAPKNFNLVIYCISYGIFRFIIEYFRGDPRGELVFFITPSQFQSILFVVAGVALLLFRLKKPHLYDIPQNPEKTNDENATIQEQQNA